MTLSMGQSCSVGIGFSLIQCDMLDCVEEQSWPFAEQCMLKAD